MKKILFLALGCAMLFAAPSCKDFLQKDPTDVPSDAIFWQSKSDFDQALTGIYAYLRGPIYYKQSYSTQSNFLSTMQFALDNLTDNSVSGNTSMDGSEDILKDIITPSNNPGFVGAVYPFCYTGIARVNIFLGKLEEAKGALQEADYKQFKGEALAARGLLYHYLYTCYGAVPIVTEALTVENMYKEKSSKEDVYKRAIDDLQDAANLLPDGQAYSANPGHFTKAAVIAFRARTRLYHAYDENGTANATEMGEILTELNQIPTGLYTLESDVLTNFHSDTQEGSSEIMFSLKFLKPNFRNQVDLFVGSWSVPCPSQSLIYAYPNADGTAFDPTSIPNINRMYYATGETTDDAKKTITEADRKVIYDAIFANRDPRVKKFFSHNNRYDFSEYVTNKPSNNVVAGNTKTYFNVRKLVTPISNEDPGAWDNGYTWQGDQDVVLMRWAHVLLMKAEAAFESGNVSAAEGYINDIRTNYGMTGVSGLTRDQLREEIRLETCFEGQRYFDMKRWRLLGTMNGKPQDPSVAGTYNVVVNPAHYDWPIPQTEIDQAKQNGVNLEQNPGY